MATPLIEASGLIGVLTAIDRLGNTRGFDMRDLRLLETVGAELSTALERGRLQEELQLAATTDPLTGLPNLTDTTRRLRELLKRTRTVCWSPASLWTPSARSTTRSATRWVMSC
jgi:GAF domain-containing protein